MMQLYLNGIPIVYLWVICIMIHPLYWMIFGRGSKLEGIGIRFFETIPRSIILSESIGFVGTIISIVLAPEHAISFIFLVIFASGLLIPTVYLSHNLRHILENKSSTELDKQS